MKYLKHLTKQNLFFVLAASCLVYSLSSCKQTAISNNELTTGDKDNVSNMFKVYQDAWLKCDSSAILSLFDD